MDFFNHWLLTILIFLPTVGAILVLIAKGRDAIRWTALATTLVTFLVSLLLLTTFNWHQGDHYGYADQGGTVQMVQRADWIPALGATRIVRTERWGPLTERRLALPSGDEIGVGIVEPSWASVVPLDPRTRQVVEGGFRILHDPHGLLRSLVAAVGTQTSA